MEEVKTEVDTVEEVVDEDDDIAGIEGFDYEDDLEYDDDGNVVIPDDDAEADTTAEEGDEPPKEEAPDPRDEEINRLKARNDLVEAQARDTLKSLGYEGDDVVEGLTKLAAESVGKTEEEYKADKAAAERLKQAEELLKEKDLEQLMAEDLAIIKSKYKVAEQFASVRNFPGVVEFARMRDAGVSPEKAFAASHLDLIISEARQPVADSKSHLRSSVPKGAKDTGVSIPSDELDLYHEMYPDLTDKQLENLYKRVTKH